MQAEALKDFRKDSKNSFIKEKKAPVVLIVARFRGDSILFALESDSIEFGADSLGISLCHMLYNRFLDKSLRIFELTWLSQV